MLERAISCLENGGSKVKPKDFDDVLSVCCFRDPSMKRLIKWKIQNALYEGTANTTGLSWIPSFPYASPNASMYGTE